MANKIVDLFPDNYDERFGVVNVRPVVDELLKTRNEPFDEIAASFETVEPEWHLALVEAMRALAVAGYCSAQDAEFILGATVTVARESGDDEYFKTINALVSSPRTVKALPGFVHLLLETPEQAFRRRLAFYVVGMLIQQGENTLESIRPELSSAIEAEPSVQLRAQFSELLEQISGYPATGKSETG